ncbi:MAG: hypothetical protein ACXVXJ_08630 [Mycobacteriaceae bacterium]
MMIGNPNSVTSRLLKGMPPFNRLPLRNWATACDWPVLDNAGSAAAADPANALLTSTAKSGLSQVG